MPPEDTTSATYVKRRLASHLTTVLRMTQPLRDRAREVLAMMVRILLLLTLLAAAPAGPVTYDRLLHADREPHNWLSYSGNYAGHRYSPLSQINRTNVKYLQLKWSYHPLYAKNGNAQNKMENTPLVVDGIMYTGTALEAVALDAVTGRQYWKLPRPLDPKAYYNAYEVNKGMAHRRRTLFWATVDCHLLAIDAKTGRVIWDKVLADYRKGYQYNIAPLVVRNMVILGPATNEAGANCWVAAYDIKTGKELWRFDTAPTSADAPAAKTWMGDSWKHGGSPIWNAGSYDPETNLTFWGTGNPNPGWNGDTRTPADNLYSDCVIALDADTGKLKWHYPVHAGRRIRLGRHAGAGARRHGVAGPAAQVDAVGQPQRLLLRAGPRHRPVPDGQGVRQADVEPRLRREGRPIKNPEFWPKPMGGIVVSPGTQGGTNWYPPSYSPHTGLFYVPTWENSGGRSAKYRRRRMEGGPALHRSRPRRPMPRRHRTRLRPAAGRHVPQRNSARRKKATARSARSIRRPARRSGTSRWSTSPSPACSPPPAISCSAAEWKATSSRSTPGPVNCSGTSISAAPAPAVPSAMPSTASSTSSARARARCSCSRCRSDRLVPRRRPRSPWGASIFFSPATGRSRTVWPIRLARDAAERRPLGDFPRSD